MGRRRVVVVNRAGFSSRCSDAWSMQRLVSRRMGSGAHACSIGISNFNYFASCLPAESWATFMLQRQLTGISVAGLLGFPTTCYNLEAIVGDRGHSQNICKLAYIWSSGQVGSATTVCETFNCLLIFWNLVRGQFRIS